MASTLKINTLTGVSTAGSIAVTGEGNSTTTNLQQGLCKAWVNIQGGGTPASQDSFNVSSLTDNATGEVLTNFSNAFSNNNFAESISAQITGTSGTGLYYTQCVATVDRTTALSRLNHYENGSSTDPNCLQSTMHGDLA